MLTYDPKASLQHWPMTNMGRFGLNPHQEPLYRIVFAPSRRHIAIDQDRNAHWIRTYRRLGDLWVMERWRDAYEYSKMTREQWDRQLLHQLGPYPDRGEYDHVHTFEAALPDQCNLEKLVSWIEEGRKRSWQENKDACRGQYEAEEREAAATGAAIIDNAYPAFGTTAISSRLVSRGTKDRPIIHTAEELGLPVGHNKFMTGTGAMKHGN